MKRSLWNRIISATLALLFVLAVPAAALEDMAAVDAQKEDQLTDPFDEAGNAVVPDDEPEAEKPAEEPAPQPEEKPVEEPAEEAAPQQPEEEKVTPPSSYVDSHGNYKAPEKLSVYLIQKLGGGKQSAGSAEEKYSGVVAFYDYAHDKKRDKPFFFYYEKGVLQDDKGAFAESRGYLNVTEAPANEQDVSSSVNPQNRLVYVAGEVYVNENAAQHELYLFAFNVKGADNGLFTGTHNGVEYVAGLAQTPAAEEAETEEPAEEAEVEAPVEEPAEEAEEVTEEEEPAEEPSEEETEEGEEATVAEGEDEVPAPAVAPITKAYSTADGMSLTWKADENAKAYKVVRRAESDTKWTGLKAIKDGSTTYVDATAEDGVNYYYAVVTSLDGTTYAKLPAITADGVVCVMFHAAPTVTVKNAVDGIKVTWTKAADATGYRVLRKAKGSSTWATVADITAGKTVTYTDTTAASGTTYSYSVRAYYGAVSGIAADKTYSSNRWSGYVAGENYLCLSATECTEVYSVNGGLQVKWTAVPGATKYTLMRKVEGGSWKYLYTATTNSYADKSAEAGTAYYYRVKAGAVVGDATIESALVDGTVAYTYHAPLNVTAGVTVNSYMIKWDIDPTATGYRLIRQEKGGEEVVLTNVSSSYLESKGQNKGSYTYNDRDNTRVSGKTYVYRVLAFYGSGGMSKAVIDNSNDWSAYKEYSNLYLTAPVIPASLDNTNNNGIKVTWKKVDGAAGYRIYRKVSGTDSWTQVGNVTNGATEVYIDTSSKVAGTAYLYTVRAVGSDNTTLSGYNATGSFSAYLPAPQFKTCSINTEGTSMSWDAISGVSGYKVYRKTMTTGWTMIADLDSGSTSYYDTEITSTNSTGVVYFYTVKGYRTTTFNGKTVTSNGQYNETGVTYGVYMNAPDGWISKNGKSYYVRNKFCVVGWQYLQRYGKTYKFYFEPETGALVTNLYSYFGESYRNMNCKIESCINSSNSNPSRMTIFLYDSQTQTYCIPAVTMRVIANFELTFERGHSGRLKAGSGQRWLDLVSFEQYCTYISGTPSWIHSTIYRSMNVNNVNPSIFKQLVNNSNNTGGCTRMQCIYAFLIQDIMKHGWGRSHSIAVNMYKNVSYKAPFGVPRLSTFSTKYEPSDPAVTKKFFYNTSLWDVTAKAGAGNFATLET